MARGRMRPIQHDSLLLWFLVELLAPLLGALCFSLLATGVYGLLGDERASWGYALYAFTVMWLALTFGFAPRILAKAQVWIQLRRLPRERRSLDEARAILVRLMEERLSAAENRKSPR